jgi:DnaJ-class molecular chaperone
MNEEPEDDEACDECWGEGTIDVGPICFRPMSECCGGCFEEETCPKCNGTGINNEEYEEV